MEREEFLSKLGIGLAAICAGSCFAACTKEKTGDPDITNITVDLSKEIKNVGDAKPVGGIIIVRLNATNVPASFTAVQLACTHEGTSINYSAGQTKFVCPNHGSEFSTSGAVIKGPATSNLKKYTIELSGDTLTVTG